MSMIQHLMQLATYRQTLEQFTRGIALVLGLITTAHAQDDSIQQDRISSLIHQLCSGNRRRIVTLIEYPLSRRYPLNAIRTPAECLRRYDEVFDETLISELKRSDPQKDWERVGWRGIMFKNGTIWLTDDYKVHAINHQTLRGKEVRAAAIEADKRSLPSMLRDFDTPVLEWKTRTRVIRVDLKGENYRLIVRNRKSPSKVMKVLQGGSFKFDGNMGAYHIDWHSNGKTHRVFSGIEPAEDSYSMFEGQVDPEEMPDHPLFEDLRRD